MMNYRIHPNGSFDLLCGEMGLLGACPAINGQRIFPSPFRWRKTPSATFWNRDS